MSQKDRYKAAHANWCQLKGMTVAEGNVSMGYTMRVMLAHTRIKAENWRKTGGKGSRQPPKPLLEVLNLITAPPTTTTTTTTGDDAQHPFYAFRATSSSDVLEPDGEEVMPIWNTLKYTEDKIIAETRMSDGSVQVSFIIIIS